MKILRPAKVGRRPAGIRVVAVAFVMIAAYSVLDQHILAIARGNLSNAGFDREHTMDPAALGISFENVTLFSDGLRLAAWWMPGVAGSANATATVILVHGHSANMTKVVRHWGPNLHAAGYSLLAFDLRNHGESDDGPDGVVTYGIDEARDVGAAVAWLRGNAPRLGIDPDGIALFGESMGAAAVLLFAAAHPVRAVISDSSYASFQFQASLDGAAQHYPKFLVDWVVQDMDLLAPSPPSASRPDEATSRLTVPLLLAHCADDARIDAASYRELLARAPASTTWFGTCPRGESSDHHVDGWANPGYNETVRHFLQGAFASSRSWATTTP